MNRFMSVVLTVPQVMHMAGTSLKSAGVKILSAEIQPRYMVTHTTPLTEEAKDFWFQRVLSTALRLFHAAALSLVAVTVWRREKS